jgi:hypothetical protein
MEQAYLKRRPPKPPQGRNQFVCNSYPIKRPSQATLTVQIRALDNFSGMLAG